ncbi:TIGR04282 family arsenosugar biosynthesis glycosyltransferase [Gaiella sp.]|uniref:TIGR04282 family arsenosugar biosynthesis glycosyltransferase n=1 Tax=Gaiella sp. TaxID=2663207 RepID=UPI003263A3A9
MTGIVLVVAKAPTPGRSKTRLVPPLTALRAAELHGCLLLDTVDACRREVADTRVLYGSESDRAPLATLLPGVPLVQQEGRGLADALRLGIARHVNQGPVAIVSSDIPGVPHGALTATFEALDNGADVVLGPAMDGGYWLIAMREADSRPFENIPWSTPAVHAVTCARCEAAGLRVVELQAWRDVDTLVDLAIIARDPVLERAPNTARLISELVPSLPEPPPLELVASELLASSPWRDHIDDRLLWEGRETSYSYLGAPRAVFVAAITAEDEMLLVRQYRHPVRDWTLEVPAGSVADGESSLEAAQRELHEEAGGEAADWVHLTTFFSSSAHLSLRSDAWLATGVSVGEAHPDEEERVTLVRMPLEEAVRTARQGGFAEGQTALTILLAAERLGPTRESGGV